MTNTIPRPGVRHTEPPTGSASAQPPGSVPGTLTRPAAQPAGTAVPGAAGRNAAALRVRLELAALLLGTAVLYLWNLGASAWANAFYSAAAQAGSQDWTAWFFGSSDAANAITVDKPPAALWITGLSVRLFGLNSWSILVPQALMGVATVWLVYLAVRRAAAPATGDERLAHLGGLLAGAVMALTPVAVLMFRFNNPDALLVLLMTAAAYAVLRAIQDARFRWLLLAGVLLGFGFLTKQLQVLLVVPGLAAAYLLAAPAGLGKRVLHLAGAGAAMVVAAGWWLAAVELIPAENRPYIGGSQTNSILELTLGYNGLGRLSGDETGSVGGGNGWGNPGLLRLFNSEFGGQIAWLLPAVLVLAGALLWIGRQAPRTDAVRASVVIWGLWVLVTGLTFSFMAGIIHPYYMVALAPGIAGLAGLGGILLWQRRARPAAALPLAAAMAAAGSMAFQLLGRSPAYLPWLRWAILIAALAAAVLLPGSNRPGHAVRRRSCKDCRVRNGPRPESAATHDGGARRRGRPRRAAGVLPHHRGNGPCRCHRERRAVRDRRGAGHAGRPWPEGTWHEGSRRHGSPPGWRDGRAPGHQHAVVRACGRPAGGRRTLHLGRRRRRFQQRGRLPVGHRASRDGRGRLQRDGSCPHAGAVPAARGGRQDPLLHWREHDAG